MAVRGGVVTAGPGASGMPARTSLRCRTVSSGGTKLFNYVRDLPPLSLEERPEPPGAATVLNPQETLLAALGSCLCARIHANAANGSIAVHSLVLDVESDAPIGPMWATPGVRPRAIGFETIRVTVHIVAEASPEALRALVAHAVIWSPVANTLHDPVHLDIVMGSTA